MSDFCSSSEVVSAADAKTRGYVAQIEAHIGLTITATDLSSLPPSTKKHPGKVRDLYCCPDKVVMVATDRQSAFDRQLASIPYKGQVLNLTSLWWFNKTRHLVPNHVIASPHANITVGRKCTVFPIEFVMRGYLTGSTSTSIWTNYHKGVRDYCGHTLPEGLVRNQALPTGCLLTPTTKDDTHDELISAAEIVSSQRMTQQDFDVCAAYAHALFTFSQQVAAERGLILVDTKYEFGRDDATGEILLIDELQTPDSSRYWVLDTYHARISASPPQEPENIDKEFLRRWYAERCDPYKDEVLPEAPAELVVELSRRYIMVYEILTGEVFDFGAPSGPASMEAAMQAHVASPPL